MNIILSFFTTRYDLMKEHWRKHSALNNKGVTGTNEPIGRDIDLGGMCVVLNWDNKKIEKKQMFSCPSGITVSEKHITIASMRKNEIYLVDPINLRIINTLSNIFLNDIHSISSTKSGSLLVASTGIDGIVEIDLSGNILWKWFAFENGFATNPLGHKRILGTKGNIDYRLKDYPTLTQTTHINSAIEHHLNQDLILVTLFHQGGLYSVSRSSGEAKMIKQGFKNIHSIRKTKNGYIFSDTMTGNIVLLDEDLDVIKYIPTQSSWLQDAIMTPRGTVLAARSDLSDIIEIDINGNIVELFSYDEKLGIYGIWCIV